MTEAKQTTPNTPMGRAFVWSPELKTRMRELGFEPDGHRVSDIPAAVRRQLEHDGWDVWSSRRR